MKIDCYKFEIVFCNPHGDHTQKKTIEHTQKEVRKESKYISTKICLNTKENSKGVLNEIQRYFKTYRKQITQWRL